MHPADPVVAQVIADLQRILTWWDRNHERTPSGTPLVGMIGEVVQRLKREYPDASP